GGAEVGAVQVHDVGRVAAGYGREQLLLVDGAFCQCQLDIGVQLLEAIDANGGDLVGHAEAQHAQLAGCLEVLSEPDSRQADCHERHQDGPRCSCVLLGGGCCRCARTVVRHDYLLVMRRLRLRDIVTAARACAQGSNREDVRLWIERSARCGAMLDTCVTESMPADRQCDWRLTELYRQSKEVSLRDVSRW